MSRGSDAGLTFIILLVLPSIILSVIFGRIADMEDYMRDTRIRVEALDTVLLGGNDE